MVNGPNFLLTASNFVVMCFLWEVEPPILELPTLLLFLFIGIAFVVMAGIKFDSKIPSHWNCGVGMSFFFSGGMDTHTSEIKPILIPGIVPFDHRKIFTALITGVIIYFPDQSELLPFVVLLESSLLRANMQLVHRFGISIFILRSKNLSVKKNLRPLLEFESRK